MKTMKAAAKIAAGLVLFVVINAVINLVYPYSRGFSAIPEDEQFFVFPALLITGLLYTLLIFSARRNSSLKQKHFIPLISAVIFLIRTFMTQIETLYFLPAFPVITHYDMIALFIKGFLIDALFAGSTAWVMGLGNKISEAGKNFVLTGKWWKYILTVFIYPVLYFSFGFLAGLSPALQEEYREFTTTTVLVQFLPLLQLGRGAAFTGISILLALLFQKRKTACILSALFLAFFISGELFYPTIIMSPALRLVHFIEITSSMLIYGFCSILLLTEKKTPQES